MISIVIPAYKNPSDVRELLESLATCCCSPIPHEVIVVDDGSDDAAFESLPRDYPHVRLLRLPSNAGAAAARNVGARAATHDVLLFLDSDMQVLSNVLDLVAEMFQHPEVSAAVGAVDPLPSNPTLFTRFWALLKAYSLPRERFSSTFYPMIGAIRRELFLRIGGFDERIKGASIEDYEISLRLRATGVAVHYNPKLLVRTGYHNMFRSLRQTFSRTGKWMLLVAGEQRFDNHTTTRSQAVGLIAGTSFLASLGAAAFSARVVPLVAVLFLVYGTVNSGFCRYVARNAGTAFVPVAIAFHLLLSVVVCVGAARALPYLASSRDLRRRAIYRD